MISYLKGKVILKGKDFVVLDVGGVGFKVFLAPNFLKKVPEKETLELFCFLYLKRTTIDLYGFSQSKQLELFKTLEAISGIGPKTALNLVSFGSLQELKRAIEKEDEEFLDKIEGIGRKKIKRIILELTGKLKKIEQKGPFEEDEALGALVSLGFSKQRAKQALLKVPKEIEETEKKIANALKILGQR